jgi:hypothetical protein
LEENAPVESTFDTRVSSPLYVNVFVERFGYWMPVTRPS